MFSSFFVVFNCFNRRLPPLPILPLVATSTKYLPVIQFSNFMVCQASKKFNAYLKERLTLAGISVGHVLLPVKERLLIDDLQVVEGHEPAQQLSPGETQGVEVHLQRVHGHQLEGRPVPQKRVQYRLVPDQHALFLFRHLFFVTVRGGRLVRDVLEQHGHQGVDETGVGETARVQVLLNPLIEGRRVRIGLQLLQQVGLDAQQRIQERQLALLQDFAQPFFSAVVLR